MSACCAERHLTASLISLQRPCPDTSTEAGTPRLSQNHQCAAHLPDWMNPRWAMQTGLSCRSCSIGSYLVHKIFQADKPIPNLPSSAKHRLSQTYTSPSFQTSGLFSSSLRASHQVLTEKSGCLLAIQRSKLQSLSQVSQRTTKCPRFMHALVFAYVTKQLQFTTN